MPNPVRFESYAGAFEAMIRMVRRVPGIADHFSESFLEGARALLELPAPPRYPQEAKNAIRYWITQHLPEIHPNAGWLSLRGFEQALPEGESELWQEYFYEGIDPANPQRIEQLARMLALALDRLVLDHGETFSATSVKPEMVLILFRYLFGEATPEEEASLRHWTDAMPEHMEIFDAAYSWFELLGLHPGERAPSALALWELAGESVVMPEKGKSAFSKRKNLVLALTAVCLLLVGIIAGYDYLQKRKATAVTGRTWTTTMEAQIIQANNLVEISLGPKSRLEQKNPGKMEFELQGSAVFEVRSGKEVSVSLPVARFATSKGHFSLTTGKAFSITQLRDTLRIQTARESLYLVEGQVANWDARTGTVVRHFVR